MFIKRAHKILILTLREMAKQSAGILLYRFKGKNIEFFLVHPGGPFFVKKDAGVWTIPKGEFTEEEDALETAKREFNEETGYRLTDNIMGEFLELSPIVQKNGKTVYAWAVEGDFDPRNLKSNTFELEWPPKSGKKQEFPEIDRGQWFALEGVKEKINPAQADLID